MKIRQIIGEQSTAKISDILRDLKQLSEVEQETFVELVKTRPGDIAEGTRKRSTDGRTFEWKKTKWINVETGRIADEKMQLNLSTEGKVTRRVRELYQKTKDEELVEPLRNELNTKSNSNKTNKGKGTDKDDGFSYQGTGLISAMQKATGFAGPSKEPGSSPDIYKSKKEK